MDNLESPIPATAESDDLRSQCDSLRQRLVSVLVLLLVVSGTFTIYLLRQYRYASTDLARLRPQAAQMISQYDKMKGPMNQFVSELIDFSRRNPDFAPILQRDGIRPTGTPAAGAGAVAPATQKKN